MVVLTGLCLPCAHARLALAHLHELRLTLTVGDHPVKAVASEVHQTPAVGDVVLEVIQAGLMPVLRVRSGEHNRVLLEKIDALLGEIVVGGNVVLVALILEPGDE
ncbi:unannotated protein [freshwater metagenome]|uniref:Unannotated protein n=1 Tax=freshwater metagenome TaxID=449393 RepID=A0A6J7QS35_9ZZZZ